MPFKSSAQRKACYATNGFGGKVDCKEWQKDTPKHLPKHVPKHMKKKMAMGGPIPKQSDYPDYESFQAAMEQFMATSAASPIAEQPALWHNDQTFEDGLDSQNPTKQVGSEGYGDPFYHDHSIPLKKPKDNRIDPYFMTRGLLNGAQWLGGIKDRNRQNQYMQQQYSMLGQNDPVNVNDYQPNPFSLYARLGGSLSKYRKMADGGQTDGGDCHDAKGNRIPCPPIVTDNKNDPRLRAYNDSLNLYKSGLNYVNNGLTAKDGLFTDKNVYPFTKDYSQKQGVQTMKGDVLDISKLNRDNGGWSDGAVKNQINFNNMARLSSNSGIKPVGYYPIEGDAPAFKKPVQPVIYQPQPQYPLVDKSKYQAQIRGNIITPEQSTYSMKGNNPIYGPANALIGMSDDQGNFYPDSNNTAKRAIVNQADTELLSKPDKLKAYLRGKGVQGEVKLKKGGWIAKAVNPAHKGYCTPMTKSTCTPKRKAFAQLMKRKHGFHK